MTAKIHAILYQPIDIEYDEKLDYFIRHPISKARLIERYGIEGDAKAGHHPNRQLNILSLEWLMAVAALGYKTNPGAFGEQIIVSELDFQALEPDTDYQIGPQAVIQFTKTRTGCSRLELAQGKSIGEIEGGIGWLASVKKGGLIQVGDPIHLFPSQPSQAHRPDASRSSGIGLS